MWSRLGIGGRLVLAFAGVMALSLISGTVGWLGLREVARTQTTVTDSAMPAAIEARGIAEASARLIAASPLLTAATTEDQRRREAANLFAGAGELRRMLVELKRHGFAARKAGEIEASVDRLLGNLSAQNDLVGRRLDLRSRADSRVAEALQTALGLFDLSETLVSNAAAGTTAVIANLYDLVEDPSRLDQTLQALDRLAESDVFLMERMFELRMRSSQTGLLLNQLSKAGEASDIDWLQENLTQNLQIIGRRIGIVHDPVRRQQAEELHARLAAATGGEPPDLFQLARMSLGADAEIGRLAEENRRLAGELGALVVDLVEDSRAFTEAAARQAETAVRVGLTTLLVLTLASLLAGSLILWLYVRRSVVARLNHLAGLMRTLAKGNLEVQVEATGDDELAEMARAIQFFKDEAIRKRELEIEQLKTEAELRRHKEELEDLVNERTLQLSDANRRLQQAVEDHAEARKRAEQASRAKSEFLATMSHEIRTPMNGMLGMLRILGNSPLEPAQREQLEIVASSGEALLSILNDILDYSKIESGRLEFELGDFDLRRLIDGVISLMQPRATEKGITLVVEYDEAVPQVLKGDAGKLRQVLFNLVGNGVKFTDEGRVAVRVERRPGDGASPVELRFEVADTGIGLPEDRKDLVFDAFFQVDSSVARRYGGTGLGLAICKKLVEALGGRIGVDSVLGHGSRFWFTLGFEPGDARALAASDEMAPTAPLRRLGPRSVLLVEDNEVSRLVASSFLEAMGHTVTLASDGQQAIEAVKASDFDLVLMDISMPRMSGIEATRRIRGLADETKRRVPIIAMSAHVFRTEIDEHLKAGMNAFIGKPISPERLERVMADVLLGQASDEEPSPPAHSAPAADLPWLARDAFAEDMQVLGAERMQHLLQVFLKATPDRVEALARAVDAMDHEAIAFAAHGLKSSATSLGLLRLAGRLEAIETAAKAGQTRRVIELHRDMDASYRQSVRLLAETWRELARRPLEEVSPGRRQTDSLLHAR